MNELKTVVLPAGVPMTEVGINQHFDIVEQKARETYQMIASKKVSAKHVAIVGGSVAGLAIVSGVVVVALKAALAATALGGVGLFLIGCGVYVYKAFPRWIRSVDNRERELVMIEQNRHIEQLQQERNRHLATLKAEARKNPVEQLQNYLHQKAQQLKSYQGFVAQIGGQVKSAIDMLTERKQQRPDRDYSKKDTAVQQMQKAYQYHLDMVDKGRIALKNLEEAVEDAKFDWKFGQVGQAAMQNMQALSGQDLLNEMLAAESFDSVRENFNQVFSEIEVQIGSINTAKQLDFGEGITLDVSAIHIPTQEEFKHVKQ